MKSVHTQLFPEIGDGDHCSGQQEVELKGYDSDDDHRLFLCK